MSSLWSIFPVLEQQDRTVVTVTDRTENKQQNYCMLSYFAGKGDDDIGSVNSVVFVDNLNTQRGKDYRSSEILSYKEPDLYKVGCTLLKMFSIVYKIV